MAFNDSEIEDLIFNYTTEFDNTLSFKVKNACPENMPPNCNITFNASNQITQYGNASTHGIPTIPDIAGLGVCFSAHGDRN
jgi:hypothetical protein